MSLKGRGAVAIWHDIAAEGRAQFYAWHGSEHMPERIAIPGFLRGRRFVAIEGAPEFFNLYETESQSTVTGADYLARLNAPTPWTIATVGHFRAVARSLCRVAASFGAGEGGLIGSFRYAMDDARADAHRSRMTQLSLPALAKADDVAGCHLLEADEAASAVETAEKKVRAERNLIPRWIVLVEGWGDAAAFASLCRGLLRDGTFADVDPAPVLGVYRVQNSCSKRFGGGA